MIRFPPSRPSGHWSYILSILISAFTLSTLSHSSLADDPTAGTKPNQPPRMSLWNGRAPNGDGTFEQADAWITVHAPEKPNGTSVVICPGGGYGGLVVGAEGHGIAKWLNQHGVTGIVLEYRLPRGRPFVPLLDAQRAIRTVRHHSREWSLERSKVGIIGFSAGGHLASTAGTHFDEGDPKSEDEIARQGCRPDFQILIYPVIVMDDSSHRGSRTNLLGPEPTSKMIELFSNEKQVTSKTPPAYLAHAKDDKAVPVRDSRVFHEALKAHEVDSEFLELPRGGHGLDGYQGPMWDAWQNGSLEWLRRIKMLRS